MAPISIDVGAVSRGDPASVFALLKDGATWPRWSLFKGYELIRPGPSDDPLGLGAVRAFITQVSKATEEIVEVIPDRRLSYILLAGFPFVGYRADVDLAPAPGGGTAIRWRANFRARYLSWFWKAFMTSALQNVATALARAAEDPLTVASAARTDS